MILTGTDFRIEDKKKQRLYDNAVRVLRNSVKVFGDRRILTDRPTSDTVHLCTDVLSAETLAAYDIEAAINTVSAFLATRREDGRIPSSITAASGEIRPAYDILTNLCFAYEALGLYYTAKKKAGDYLNLLYTALSEFDEYLWSRHDLNANGCLEIFNAEETEEGAIEGRYAPIRLRKDGQEQILSPFPVESFDLMAMDHGIKKVLVELSALLGTDEGEQWEAGRADIASRLRNYLWLGGFNSCYDRDYRGSIIDIQSINQLFILYHGAADTMMAEGIMNRHICNPQEYWTAMPLPTIAFNNRHFVNDDKPNFTGQPRGVTYRRAVRAFDRYGYYRTLTEVGKRLIAVTEKQCLFTEQFNPFTSVPTGKNYESHYAPTASAVLEFIKRFWGVYNDYEQMSWGALGHENDISSEYNYHWGSDTYSVSVEGEITVGSINGSRLFVITGGTRIFTDMFGRHPVVANVTGAPIDTICVYRGKTFSFRLNPNAVYRLEE